MNLIDSEVFAGFQFRRHFLALFAVALLPIELLAVARAVQTLLALAATLVLHRLRLRGTAVAAHIKHHWGPVGLSLADQVLHLANVLEPTQGRIVGPRVDVRDALAGDSLLWQLLGAIPIFKVEFCELAQIIETVVQVLSNKVDRGPGLFLLFVLALVSHPVFVVLERPEARLAQKGP